MGSRFDCKWDSDVDCNKCSGCRNCGNCKHFDKEYWEINDAYDCCKWCADNPSHDDRNN